MSTPGFSSSVFKSELLHVDQFNAVKRAIRALDAVSVQRIQEGTSELAIKLGINMKTLQITIGGARELTSLFSDNDDPTALAITIWSEQAAESAESATAHKLPSSEFQQARAHANASRQILAHRFLTLLSKEAGTDIVNAFADTIDEENKIMNESMVFALAKQKNCSSGFEMGNDVLKTKRALTFFSPTSGTIAYCGIRADMHDVPYRTYTTKLASDIHCSHLHQSFNCKHDTNVYIDGPSNLNNYTNVQLSSELLGVADHVYHLGSWMSLLNEQHNESLEAWTVDTLKSMAQRVANKGTIFVPDSDGSLPGLLQQVMKGADWLNVLNKDTAVTDKENIVGWNLKTDFIESL